MNTEEDKQNYAEIVGIRFRNFIDIKTHVVTSIESGGREIFKCPYNDQDTLSTICLLEAVKKLANKVVYDIKRDYIEAHTERERSTNHETDYELMCELKNHMLKVKE